ncbi:trimeric intracellular cation channel family protein [Francisellaceae bacterium]|nr:trimeric intracellular cation channel family protein [Francisellaceae bacterium]
MSYIEIITYIAVVAICISGVIAAYTKRINLMGCILIGSITAFGGGTIRDILLDRYPIYWIVDGQWLLITTCVTIFTIIFIPIFKLKSMKYSIELFDALGMVIFAITGSYIAHDLGHYNIAICAVMGTITGIVGGLLRDIICDRVPLVLRSELYLLPSFLTGLIYMTLIDYFDFYPLIDQLIAISIGFTIRILALTFGIKLSSDIFRKPFIKSKVKTIRKINIMRKRKIRRSKI